MANITLDQKYFKKRIQDFLYNGYVPMDKAKDPKLVDILYQYNIFLRQNHFRQTFNNHVFTVVDANHNLPSFKAGVEAMAAHTEVVMAAMQAEIANLHQQLTAQKQKRRALLKTSTARIKQLEKEVASQPVMAKMAMAYKAGTQAMTLVERQPMCPELKPYLAMKQTMNFPTWANKVWKYGKGKLTPPKVKYKMNLPKMNDEWYQPEPNFEL